MAGNWAFLDELYALLQERKGNDPERSYVAKLYHKGTDKIAEKIGEEATETVIAAVKKQRKETISESADLLFHLLVLWADAGIEPKEVVKELKKRKGTSGVEEKNARKNR